MEKVATENKYSLIVPLRWEIWLFGCLFALAVFLRFYHLAADPPQGITFSQDIETDPPQYTIYARNDALTGEWNPYHDNRYVTYQYSLVSLTSRVVFALFGVGTYQANLVGVILSLLTILLFYFVIRRALGNGVALLTLFFIGVNYLGIFFGRRPFLETGMNFLFVAGLFCLTYLEERRWGHFLFGFFLGSSILFGKIIGLAFGGVPLIYYGVKYFQGDKRAAIIQLGLAVAGAASVGIVWFSAVFLPNSESVTGYVGEQAIGLYGMPEGLRSPLDFIWKYLTFGRDSEFFERMAEISIGSAVMIILLSAALFDRRKLEKSSAPMNLIPIAIAGWLISSYLAQMPWNYQPVRYQTTMIFPMAALTAMLIAHIHELKGEFNILRRSLTFNLVFVAVLSLILYQVLGAAAETTGFNFFFSDLGFVVPLLALFLALIYYLVAVKKQKLYFVWPALARYATIGLIIGLTTFYQGRYYLNWAATPLYTTRDASRDLGISLSPGAVISGPFGPALALENNLGCVIHIFGTSRPDTLLFQKYPITHLALEKSNEEVARQIYPAIMERARKVSHFYLDCRKVNVFRIAYATGHPRAGDYLKSSYEQAVTYYERGRVDSAEFYMNRFLKMEPENISGNAQKAFAALIDSRHDTAITYFSRALASSPTDFYLHYLLGKAYNDQARARNDSLNQDGPLHMDLATRYNLGYIDFELFDEQTWLRDTLRDSTSITD